MGTVSGSGSIKVDAALNQLKSLDDGAEARIVKVKNGEFQIKTGQAKGRFRQYQIFPGLAKKATLRQQQQLVNQIQQLSPKTDTPLNERKVFTVSELRTALLNIQEQSNTVQPPAPSPKTASISVNQLVDHVTKGDPAFHDTLETIEDLDLVAELEARIAPMKNEITAMGDQQKKNYTAVKFRRAKLTGIHFAKAVARDSNAKETITKRIQDYSFSKNPGSNRKLQDSALKAALSYFSSNPAPTQASPQRVEATSGDITQPPASQPDSPAERLAEYYLGTMGRPVESVDAFKKEFALQLDQLPNRSRIPNWALEDAVVEIERGNTPSLDAAKSIARSILAQNAGTDDQELWNLRRYNELKPWTDALTKDVKNIKVAGSRFGNIPSPAQTNVPISVSGGAAKKGEVHANFVSGTGKHTAIAAQYPPDSARGKASFWRMALQNSAQVIVDLTQTKDVLNRAGKKPEAPYYPAEVGKTARYEDIEVTFTKDDGMYKSYTVRDTATNQTREILRQDVQNWQDHSTLEVKDFAELTATLADQSLENMVVHCRAGSGRTGTLLLGTSIQNLVKNGEITKDNINQVDDIVDQLILRLRQDRNSSAVQTEGQRAMLVNLARHLVTKHQ